MYGAPVSPPGVGWAVFAGITAGALVVELKDDTKDVRLERLQATLRRLKQVQDAFPPGLRETLAAVDRLTAPTRERRMAISDLLSADHLSVVRASSLAVEPVDALPTAPPPPGADLPGTHVASANPAVEARNPSSPASPAVPAADLASIEGVHLATELDAIAKIFEAGPTDEATATPNVQAAMVRGLAALLRQSLGKARAKGKVVAGHTTGPAGPIDTPTVPISNMREGLAGTDWTSQQRAALLAQVEGHPDWSRRARKQLAYAAVEDESAWNISVSTRKAQLAIARAERKKDAGGAAQPGRHQVRQGKRQG